MKRQDLEKYIINQEHKGSNNPTVFNNFKQYLDHCCDPQNIIRYMQEAAICTFLPIFWITKAQLLQERGQYTLCFQCMQEAISRQGIADQQNLTLKQIESKQLKFEQNLQQLMKIHVIKKRSPAEYKLNQSQNPPKLEQLLQIYDEKYTKIKNQKTKKYEQKRQRLPQSCFYKKYQEMNQKQYEIQQKIIQNSIKISQSHRCHSMFTPSRHKNINRLHRALDSVQMQKRKSSKPLNQQSNQQIKSVQDDQVQNFSSHLVYSLPVGNKFKQKKRVTFSKIEKDLQLLRCPPTNQKQNPLFTTTRSRKTSIIKFKLFDRSKSSKKIQK